MSSQQEAPTLDPDLGTTRSVWAPFASRAFVWLWLANTVSALGTWIQNAASAWIMTDLAPSPIDGQPGPGGGATAGASSGSPGRSPGRLDGPQAPPDPDQHADAGRVRYAGDRRGLGRVDSIILLTLTVLLAVGAALNGPAWAASVPLTVPRRSLTQALVLNSVGFNIARAIGPAIGGLILAVAGATTAFAANAASFAFVAVVVAVLLTFPRSRRQTTSRPSHSARRCASALRMRGPNRWYAALSSARRRSSVVEVRSGRCCRCMYERSSGFHRRLSA